jgi:hypothetical protein
MERQAGRGSELQRSGSEEIRKAKSGAIFSGLRELLLTTPQEVALDELEVREHYNQGRLAKV